MRKPQESKTPPPRISTFNGETVAVHILEKIMSRQRYSITVRDVLISKIENVVFAEMERQKKHRENMAAWKKNNRS